MNSLGQVAPEDAGKVQTASPAAREGLNAKGQASGPARRVAQVMRHHPTVSYFVLALGLTWLYEVTVFGLLHVPFMLWSGAASGIVLGLVGPTASAFIMTALTEGKPGVRRLLHRYVLWCVGLPWYLVVLLGIPALMLLGTILLFGPAALFRFRAPPLLYFVNYVGGFIGRSIIDTPLSEEPGWRGFALPRLEQQSGPLVGSLILGVLWSVWHLPLFVIIPGFHGAGSGFAGILTPFLEFLVGFVGLTIIMTWVFNNTRGSLLLAILLHTSLNTTWSMLLSPKWDFLTASRPANVNTPLAFYLSFVVAALVIIVTTRGRLSCERYQPKTTLPTIIQGQAQEKGEARTSI